MSQREQDMQIKLNCNMEKHPASYQTGISHKQKMFQYEVTILWRKISFGEKLCADIGNKTWRMRRRKLSKSLSEKCRIEYMHASAMNQFRFKNAFHVDNVCWRQKIFNVRKGEKVQQSKSRLSTDN